ncbi:MAG: hypothetical protein IIV65_00470 [Alistipes sp.]|nr:hypothetical protein [Alistipes sp.]
MSETFVWVTQYVNLGKTHAEGLPQSEGFRMVQRFKGGVTPLAEPSASWGRAPKKSIR